MNDLRKATDNFKLEERSETRKYPKEGSHVAVENLIKDAFKDQSNETFTSVCKDVVTKFHASAKKSYCKHSKNSFVCAIFAKDKFKYDQMYKKFWYYEYNLDDKFTAVFLKVDHDLPF